ncbi:DUF2310 family Zn-ribbon-containing protein [Alishewanella sp. HL-SH06]|uniref:DUF2310 family Zn-ribbon-containing protein n=1 Tax=Alishewanella sp. HL-SH06 TaxID=3461144 RepID=UPI004042EF9F
MYLAELRFRVIADTDLTQAEQAIRAYIEALIFNGQVLGREFPTAWQQDTFSSRVVLASQDALASKWHSNRVRYAEQQLTEAGLGYAQHTLLGADLMSQQTCETLPKSLILFTSFADTCSPLRCAETLRPVPLFWLTAAEDDFEALIRWQIQYQALDEIQLQEDRVLPKIAENSLQQLHSKLNRRGRQLAQQISRLNQLPIWYALYSGSSSDCQQDANKCCPGCGADWRLATPRLEMFDFQCDNCQLLSNIAWECQSKQAS